MIDENISIDSAILDIIKVHEYGLELWSKCDGWAPEETVYNMENCNLDSLVSFSRHLPKQLERIDGDDCNAVDLLLVWTVLGGLVAGSLRWFLCVYNDDYMEEPYVDYGRAVEPERLPLYNLIKFYKDSCCDVNNKKFNNQVIGYLNFVKMQRNKLHFFSSDYHSVGSSEVWKQAVFCYRLFILMLNNRVPYPDEHPDCPINKIIDLDKELTTHVNKMVSLYT